MKEAQDRIAVGEETFAFQEAVRFSASQVDCIFSDAKRVRATLEVSLWQRQSRARNRMLTQANVVFTHQDLARERLAMPAWYNLHVSLLCLPSR